MKKTIKNIVLLLIYVFCFSLYAKSQAGTEFWFAAPEVTAGHGTNGGTPIYLRITTLSDTVDITVSIPANADVIPLTASVNPYSAHTFNLTSWIEDIETKPADSVLNTGLLIESTGLITCYYEIATFYNPELFALKGPNGLGYEFYIPHHNLWDNGVYTPQPYTSFDIVATEDSTTVRIMPKKDLVGGHSANESFEVILNRGQTYSAANSTRLAVNHPVGSIVVANKPVAVTIKGDSETNSTCRDLTGDQLVPIDAIGYDYIVVRGNLKVGHDAADNDHVFIVATSNNTDIYIDDEYETTLFNSEFYAHEIPLGTDYVYISASKPVYAYHISGYGCEMGAALLPSLNCAGSERVAFVRSTDQSFSLNILVLNGYQDYFNVDGPGTATIDASDFDIVPGTNDMWAAARVTFNTTEIPVDQAHTIYNDSVIFSLGIINGGATTGCRYGYFSEFISDIYVDAGPNQFVCAGKNAVLSGSVSGGSTTGRWTTTGNGTFTPSATSLDTEYIPGSVDILNGFVKIYLTSTGLCYPVTDSLIITITPAPTADAGPDQSVCANNSAVTLSGSVTVATGGIWSGGGGTFSPSNTNLNATYTPTPAEISAGTLELTLTTTGNGDCDAVSDIIIITFTPAPTANAGSDQTLCANNANATLNGGITVAGGGIWTGGNGSYNPSNTALSTVYTPSAGEIVSGSVTLTLTTTNNGNCNAVSDDVTINFTPAPTVNAGSDQTLCLNNAVATLDGSVTVATGGSWSGGMGTFSPNNTTLNATYTPTGGELTNGSVTLTLTSTGNGNCNAVSDNVIITYTPAPTADAGPNQTVCSNNADISLSGSVTVATGGIWSGGSGTFNPGNTSLNAVYTPTPAEISAGTLTLTLTTTGNGNCNPVSDDITITFSPAPTANAGSDQTLCANNADVTLNGSITVAGGGIWTGGSGFFDPSNTALSAVYTPSPVEISNGSVTLTLTTTDNGNCNAVSDDITINFTPAPTVNAGSDQTLCSNNAVATLDGSVTVATGGVWSGGMGTFLPDNQTLDATYTPTGGELTNGSVTLTLTSTGNGNCIAVSDDVIITYTPAPTADAGPNQTVCSNNADITLSGSVTVATGGIWSGGNGAFNPGNTSLNAVYTPTPAEISAGTLTLTLTTTGHGNCNPVSDDITITFSPAPTANAGSDQTLCANNADVTLNGSVTVAGGGIWTGGSGFFDPGNTALSAVYTPSPVEISNGSVTLTLTTTDNGNCNAVSDDVTIYFTPAPIVDAGSDQTLCSNNAEATLDGSITVATGGVWSGGLGFFTPNSQTLNAVYTPTSAEITSGSVTLILTSTGNGNCNPETDEITIYFTPSPTADAGPDQTVCANNSQVNLSGSVTIATGGQWSGGTGIFSPSNTSLNATYTPSSAEIAAGSITLTLTTTGNGNCNPVSDVMIITITPSPIVNAGSNLISCANNPTVTLSGSVVNAGGGIWSGGMGVFNPSNTALNTTYTPTADEILAGGVSLTLTSTNHGTCFPVSDNMNISITSAPIVDAGTDQTLCANNPNANLVGSVIGATGGQWSGGMGQFMPDPNSLNVTYIPTQGEIVSGGITLTLTSTGNGSCNPEHSNITISYTPAPTVDAGPDQVVCANNASTTLNGNYTISGGAVWSGGNGTYSPNNTTMDAVYTPSSTEIAAGQVTLTLTTTENGNCIAVSDDITIYIDPAPQVSAGLDITACQNNPNVTLNGIILNAGGGIWSGGNGTFIPSNTVLNAQYLPTSAEIASGELVLTLTSTGNGSCLPVEDDVKITFNPSPIADAGSDQTLCANNNVVTLNGQVTNAGGGLWSGGMGMFSPNNSILNATYTPSQTEINNGMAMLILTTTGNGVCLEEKDTVFIYYTPAPTVDAGSNFSICDNNSVAQLDGSVTIATGGIWTGGNGTFIPGPTDLHAQYIPTQNELQSGTITLTLTTTGNGLCNPVSDDVQISVTQAPIVIAGQDETVCVDDPVVSLNGYIGGITTTGQWSSTGTGNFLPNENALNATYVASEDDGINGSVQLILTSTNNGLCNPVSDTLLLTILPEGFANAGDDITVCANNSTGYLNGSVSGGAATGTWSSSGTGVFVPNPHTLNATYIPSGNDIAIGTIYLILTANSCNIAKDTAILTITPAPVVNAGNDITVCVDELDIQLNGEVYGGTTTGMWTTTGTGIFTPDNTTLDAVYHVSSQDSINQHVSLILISTNNGNCNTVYDTIHISILQEGVVNAGSNQTVCANNADVQLNGQVYGGASQGLWSTSGTGNFIPDLTTLDAVYIPSEDDKDSGTVSIVLSATDACNFPTDMIYITITPAPTANAGEDMDVCANNPDVNLLGEVTVAVGGVWSGGAGTYNPGNTSLNTIYTPSAEEISDGTVTLTLTTTGSGDCFEVSDQITINITPTPTVNAGDDQYICKNNAEATLDGSVTIATGGIWSGGMGTFLPDNQTLDATYTPTGDELTNGSVTLTLTSTGNGNCNPETDEMTIYFTPSPTVDAGIDQVVCENNADITLSGSVTIATGGIWNGGEGSFNPDNVSLNTVYTPTPDEISSGEITLTLTTTGHGNCNPESDDITITFSPAPTVNAGEDQVLCANNANAALSGSYTIAGGIIWSTTGSGVFVPDNTSLNVEYQPSVNDTENGSVSIILTTTDNGDCLPVEDIVDIIFTPAPLVNAGVDQNVCITAGSTDLLATISGGASQGIWTTTGDGTFSPSDDILNPEYIFGTDEIDAGFVDLILTSTDNGDCFAVSDTMRINFGTTVFVYAGEDKSICSANPEINLSGFITGGSSTGIWSSNGTGTFFPDETSLDLIYYYSTEDSLNGEVEFYLESTNNGPCDTGYDTIKVNIDYPSVVNVGTDLDICSTQEAVQLSVYVSGTAASGIWSSSGNGSFTPDVNDLSPEYYFGANDYDLGFVDIVFSTTDHGACNIAKDTLRINIWQPNIVDAGAEQIICASEPYVELSGTISGGTNTGIWTSPGDGTFSPDNTDLNATYLYGENDYTDGSVQIILTSTNNIGCEAKSDTMNIEIIRIPVVNAGQDKNVCYGIDSIFVQGSVSNATGGIWTTSGSGYFIPTETSLSATYIVNQNDTIGGQLTFVLTSTGNDVCALVSDTIYADFIVPLEPDFTYSVACEGKLINFNDNTTIITGSITDWEWDFGNENIFNAENISFVFDESGNYPVSLTVTSSLGCDYTISRMIYVNSLPTVNCPVYDDVCVDAVPFSLIGANPVGGDYSGNGVSNGEFDPGTAGAGVHEIAYTYTDSEGCDNYCTFNITVNLLPTIYCPEDLHVCINTLPFTLTGALPSGGIYTGTGVDGTVFDPETAGIGVHEITYNYTDGNDCENFCLFNITVSDLPVVTCPADTSVCANALAFELTGAIPEGGEYIFDGTVITDFNPVTAGTGIHEITYTHIDANGCENFCTFNITVNSLPEINFSYINECYKDSVVFEDLSSDLDGDIVEWLWEFGDEATSTLQNPSHKYEDYGIYNVILYVTASTGCSASDSIEIIINNTPIADFGHIYDCSNFSVLFSDSTISNGNIINFWNWEFGDNNSSTEQNPSNIYSATGTYDVTLISGSTTNCVDTVTMPVYIYVMNADFTFNNACANDIVYFTDISDTDGSSIESRIWDFGNGNISENINPQQIYVNPGIYNVKLSIRAEDGCEDSIIHQVTIYELPYASFSISGGEFNNTSPIVFQNNSIGANSYYWDFGDNTGTSESANPSYLYENSGIYQIFMIAYNEYDCSDTAYQDIIINEAGKVYPPVLPTAFTPNNDGVNDILYVRGGPFKEIDFKVFNEWGHMIFQTNDTMQGWDGMRNNVPQPIGVYIYTVKAITATNQEYNISGEVMLMR